MDAPYPAAVVDAPYPAAVVEQKPAEVYGPRKFNNRKTMWLKWCVEAKYNSEFNFYFHIYAAIQFTEQVYIPAPPAPELLALPEVQQRKSSKIIP